MTIWHSSDLGWKSGQDVSSQFAKLVQSTFKAGDTFVLDHMYKVSGSNLKLPANFTLAAERGAGFDLQNTNANSSPFLQLSDGVTLDNLTITASGAPKTGYGGANAASGRDYHTAKVVGINNADDVTIKNSSFAGNVQMFLDVVDSDNLKIEKTHFFGAMYQIRLLGSTDDARIIGSHFESALGDGIKTERGGSNGPQRAQVIDSFFENNNRDGIDTAGGFKDSKVSGSVFYNNGVSALDLKVVLERSSDLSPNIANSGILIENSQIIDSRNAIVVTMLDRIGVLNKSNADKYMPHDIKVVNTVFENTSAHKEEMRAFLVKDGYDITWSGLKFLGDIDELRVMNIEAPAGWNARNVGGSETHGAARNLPVSKLWSSEAGAVVVDYDLSTPSPAPKPAPGVTPTEAVASSVSVPAVTAPAVSGSVFDFSKAKITGFSKQDSGDSAISSGGAAITLTDNAWKTIWTDVKVTAGTVLSFDFLSTKAGEIHAIGLESDNRETDTRFFQLDGEQSWGRQNYDGNYTTGTGFKHYDIDVGKFYTGNFDRIVLVMDDDARLGGNSTFANLQIKTAATTTSATSAPTVTPSAPASKTGSEAAPSSKTVFSLQGDTEIDGSSGSVREFAPKAATKIDSGLIAFKFNADTVSGDQGLISKDAKGTDVNNGHFTSYIANGNLLVRFQEDTATRTYSVDGIKADTDHTVAAAFGDGEVALWVDGKLVGKDAFDWDLSANNEYLQVGANGWASASGKAGFSNPFDGTISDVAIVDAAANDAGTLAQMLMASDDFIF